MLPAGEGGNSGLRLAPRVPATSHGRTARAPQTTDVKTRIDQVASVCAWLIAARPLACCSQVVPRLHAQPTESADHQPSAHCSILSTYVRNSVNERPIPNFPPRTEKPKQKRREAENVSHPGSPAKTPRVKPTAGTLFLPPPPLSSRGLSPATTFYLHAVLDNMQHTVTHTHTHNSPLRRGHDGNFKRMILVTDR